MNCRIIILAIVVLSATANGRILSYISNCAPHSKLGKLILAEVPTCHLYRLECRYKYMQRLNVTIDFESEKNIPMVLQKVNAKGIGHPAEISFEKAACVGNGLMCPLTAGKHTYSYSLLISPLFAKGPYTTKFELKTKDQEDIVCIEFTTEVMH